ncbi:hypothetical protein OE88DRAFT_124247 [Heliocybe sulcata]|uniref:Uncharacterized protein n=1 Tax=Heliocybe sulcata TaxID=5364 RepID=A0A5C3NLH7_9AGAM|nr:hypothetical protein OE88DRAFT_124247 [Heliocybe sulcata]
MSTRDSAIDVDSWEPEIQLEVQRKNTLRPNKRKVQADIIDLSHEEEIGKRNGQIARKRQKASTSSTPSAQGPSRWKSQEATYVCDSDEELALMTASPAINDVAPDYELDDIPIASFHQEQPGPDESDDSEDDWANCYEGYNIIQGRSWKPSAVPLTEPPDSMDDLVDELNNLTVVEEPVQVGYNRMHKHLQLPHLELPVGGGYRPYPWANVSRPGYRPSGHGPAFYAGTRRLQMTGRRMQALPREIGMVSGLEYLPHVTRICKAPGCKFLYNL